MLRSTVLAVCATVVLCGCGMSMTRDGAGTTRAGAAQQLVCDNAGTIGSHMPKRNCRTRAEAERERRAAQEALQRQQKIPSIST